MDRLAREFVPPDGSGRAPEIAEERRTAPRVTVLIRPGKLIVDGREFLCVVRDVSEGGLKVRLFAPLPAHESAEIEFDNGERQALHLVWQAGEQAGFAFAAEVDVAQVIASHRGTMARRPPRLRIEVEGVLCTAGLRMPIVLRDISLQGAAIDTTAWLMIDELVRIECDRLPTLHAKVRWRRPPRYGLIFEQTFRFDDLARALAKLHSD